MKLWAWDEKNLPSTMDAIRTAVAATVSVIIARLVQMPEAYWAAIATLVVMQSTLGATLTLSLQRIVAAAVGASVGALEANFSAQIWLRSRLRSFSSDCCRSRFVWRRLRIATPALPSRSSFSFRARARRGPSRCTGSLKSQSESSLLSRLWRCGQNIDDCQSVAPPNSTSFAIAIRTRLRKFAETETFLGTGVYSFTSTPASFSSALMRAQAFSFPKPRATADSRFFSATRSAGMGEDKLAANFSIRPASLSMSLSAKLVEKSRFKIF